MIEAARIQPLTLTPVILLYRITGLKSKPSVCILSEQQRGENEFKANRCEETTKSEQKQMKEKIAAAPSSLAVSRQGLAERRKLGCLSQMLAVPQEDVRKV